MHSLSQLQKQQVGLRLPKYIIEQIDELSEEYQLNRTDIILESIRAYLEKVEMQRFYENFDKGCKELGEILKHPEKADQMQTLDAFLDEN